MFWNLLYILLLVLLAACVKMLVSHHLHAVEPGDHTALKLTVEAKDGAPELEMLLIISEGLVKEFEKIKTKVSPKAFAKQNVSYNRARYDNSSRFYREYYGSEPQKLINAIREYKRINGAHQKDELYLANILK